MKRFCYLNFQEKKIFSALEKDFVNKIPTKRKDLTGKGKTSI